MFFLVKEELKSATESFRNGKTNKYEFSRKILQLHYLMREGS